MGEKLARKSQDDNHDQEIKKPIDPKRVIQILEFKRKILSFTEAMMEAEISDERLRSGEEFICQRDYDSIVQERYLIKLCGYPLCSNNLTREWKQRFHVSLKDKKIYDVEVRKLYCSVNCMNTSTRYRDDRLHEQPIWMRLKEDNKGPIPVVHTSNT